MSSSPACCKREDWCIRVRYLAFVGSESNIIVLVLVAVTWLCVSLLALNNCPDTSLLVLIFNDKDREQRRSNYKDKKISSSSAWNCTKVSSTWWSVSNHIVLRQVKKPYRCSVLFERVKLEIKRWPKCVPLCVPGYEEVYARAVKGIWCMRTYDRGEVCGLGIESGFKLGISSRIGSEPFLVCNDDIGVFSDYMFVLSAGSRL